jgi:hypothetical protein
MEKEISRRNYLSLCSHASESTDEQNLEVSFWVVEKTEKSEVGPKEATLCISPP